METAIDRATDRPELEHRTALLNTLGFLRAAFLQVVVGVSERTAVQIFLDLQGAAGRIADPEFIVKGQRPGADDIALPILHACLLTLDMLVQQLVGGAVAQGDQIIGALFLAKGAGLLGKG
ncbi:MAG: hypothetical protein PVJ21_13555, partial [Anaerolineales bacterium]